MIASGRSAFQKFSWLHGDLQNDCAAEFAARIKDLGFGVHKCLQLIESSDLDRAHGASDDDGNSYAPLLDAYDTGVLMRLALTTAQIIGEQAEEFLDQAQKRCDKAQAAALPVSEEGRLHG